MPELPEVQTIVNELSLVLPGKKILGCRILRPIVIDGDSKDFISMITGRIITKVTRRGKYILFFFDNEMGLLVHLRMTGKFVYQSSPTPLQPHDRVQIVLNNHCRLLFNDVRCFGKLEIVKTWKDHKALNKLGIDALDPNLDEKKMLRLFKGKKSPIKPVLLNSALIAGIGNIYASEILFKAGISPFLPAGSLTMSHAKKLDHSMKWILTLALKKNGTSISDYRRVDDKQGEFQNFLAVYQKQNRPCQKCSFLIKKVKQNQRSTFYCPTCQK